MIRVFGKIRIGPEVYPLLGILAGACGIVGFFAGNAALKYPDVAWDHKKNPHPWLSVKENEKVKIFAHTDYKDIKSDRPEY